MPNKVLLKKSSVAAKVPLAADLDYGEIALNYQDGKIYYKKADNSIDSFTSTTGSVASVASVAGNTGAVTATQLITAINTVDGSGSGLDADLLDGRDSLYFAPDSHKYHTFNTGTYYYDSYSQYRFFRLFTENYYSDTLRYCPINSVEYFNYTNSTWEDWTSGGLGGVKNLLDGQDGTQMELDHAHRKFRFVVTKSTGWPTDVLIAMYTSWWGNAWTNIVLTVEDAATTAGPWTVKETLTFNSTNTNADYGWHAYASGNVHNGRTATRITVDIPDWVDQPGYTTKRINTISMFSNYSGDKLQPWIWNYDKNVTFYNTPYVNANQVWHAGNDGTGSGLDADLLDGYNIGTSGGAIPLLNGANTWSGNQIFTFQSLTVSNAAPILRLDDSDNGANTRYWEIIANGNLRFRTVDDAGAQQSAWLTATRAANGTVGVDLTTTSLTSNTNIIWHAGNDGAASGLDADLLDGQQGSYYLDTSATAQTKTGDLTITGNLTVNGTTVTINSTTLTVDDKNIELGSIASPTDTTADGGGITLKGATDKTFNWVQSTGYWTASNSLSAPRLVSTVATGTSPLIVTSTTLVTNLNADLLDGADWTSRDNSIFKTTGSYIAGGVYFNSGWKNQNATGHGFYLRHSDAAGVTAGFGGRLDIGFGFDASTGVDTAAATLRTFSFDRTGQLTIPAPTGTAPFVVSSTTLVTNLNADLLGGTASSSYVTLTGTQTLTNKTLTAPVINGSVNFDSNTLFVDSVNDRIGIGTITPSSRLQVGAKVADDNVYTYDANSLYVVHQTATSTTVLNDPKEVLLLARQGTSGQAFGAAASFRLSRYENNSTNSRTRLDLVLAHDSFLGSPATVLSARSDGNVGIGTSTVISDILHVRKDSTGNMGIIVQNRSGSGTPEAGIKLLSGSVDLTDSRYSEIASAGGTSSDLSFRTALGASPTTKMYISPGGNVGVGTIIPAYKLEVNGSFAATTKSFVIDHPTKPDMKLRYGSLEGPENGVYVRGRLKGNKIELPDYWTKLVDPESITVSLTSVGKHQDLYVKSIENNTITVANSNLVAKGIDCFYTVYAERCDVDKLQVEIAK